MFCFSLVFYMLHILELFVLQKGWKKTLDVRKAFTVLRNGSFELFVVHVSY